MPTNDNDVSERPIPPHSLDPHGHAALLLVESLLHGLCENATLTPAQAYEIAERARDVQLDHVEAADDTRAMRQAHALISDIVASLRVDLADDALL